MTVTSFRVQTGYLQPDSANPPVDDGREERTRTSRNQGLSLIRMPVPSLPHIGDLEGTCTLTFISDSDALYIKLQDQNLWGDVREIQPSPPGPQPDVLSFNQRHTLLLVG